MSVPVLTAWCGGCGSALPARPDADAPETCPTCALPVSGPDADRLRASAQDYRAARARGDEAAADRLRREHAAARERLEAQAAGRPPLPPPDVVAVDDARISASTLVTWAGAALLLAGGFAFATVVWRYTGGPGRIAILVVVTLASLLAADRLRRTAPTTAEAATTIAAGMVVVDAVAAYVAGYVPLDPTGWAAITLLPAGAAFLALARRWRSRAAGICGATLVALGTAGLATWPMTWSAGLPGLAVAALAAAIACAALGLAARHARPGAERAALVAAAVVLWVLQGGTALVAAALALTFRGDATDGWVLLLCLSVAAFALLPLTTPLRGRGTAVLAGLAAAGPLVLGTSLAVGATYQLAVVPPVAALLRVAVLALLVAAPTVCARLAPTAASADRTRAAALAVTAGPAYVLLALLVVSDAVHDDRVGAALVLALLAGVLAAPAVLLDGRVPAAVAESVAATALVGLLGVSGVLAPAWPGVATGDALATTAAVAALVALLLPRGTWGAATTWAACVTVVLAAASGTTVLEAWSVPAAVVAAALGVHLRRTGVTSSWLAEAPAAALLLLPSLALALAGERTGLRLTAVAVVGALVLLDAARRHRQGPAVVAAVALGVTAGWVALPHVSEVPSWAALAGSGALLLWVGFTWESRRATARRLAQSWSTWE